MFGDHTKIVKYIDFKFCPGADGTKLFKPLDNIYAKYFYYLTLFASFNIENRGYGRHFALLKKQIVPVFRNREMQFLITYFLDYVFYKIDCITKLAESIDKLKEIIKAKIINLGIQGKLLNSDDNYYYQKELKTIELGKALIYEQPTNYIVQSEDYSDEYKTPVLTAGKSFILGKSNETNGIFKASIEPVLIFDDFTTSHHYVDFDFKVKSSAMKILKSTDKENYDIKFLNYLLSSISINANTHKRYWISIFAKLNVEIPSIKFQQKIVKIIETLINKLNLSD